jgi:alginate O-acetyltransferase complex protein AlgI
VIFSSTIFLVYFLPLAWLLYLLMPVRFRNAWLLLLSLVFYAWGAPKFVFVLVISALIDHWAVTRVNGLTKAIDAAIAVNVLNLFVFKYFNFFIDNAARLAEAIGFAFPAYMEIALPLGISFFTFQKISYLLDVRRGEVAAARFTDYLLYVSLFPQLVAGPIVRYKEIVPQIKDRSSNEQWLFRLAGFQRFALGLLKKVMIADVLATLADQAFAADQLGTLMALVGLLAFTFQIYFDFSAYSDMAIGLGMMFGFRFPENFNWPYAAIGFRSFWRKWHMTMSAWMRDYLYFPLGGNLKGKVRTAVNLWIVFLLSGLWHGASWTFVVWGVWHGLFITLDRTTSMFRGRNPWVGGILTFSLVMLSWVWFRANSLEASLHYFAEFFRWELSSEVVISNRQWATLVIAVIFSFLPPNLHEAARHYHGDDGKRMWVKTILSLVFILLCLGQLSLGPGQPFIYFRF